MLPFVLPSPIESLLKIRNDCSPVRSTGTARPPTITEKTKKDTDIVAFSHAIFLMGPTTSGKSSLSLQIARHWPVEIVSVDSAQVYRHMDIGTAKPETKTRIAVPHHLIDLIDPHERYSAAQFRLDALRAMKEIAERGNIPLLAGGTMLYFKALLEGLSELPAANSDMRETIEAEAAERGWPAMHETLSQLDPVSAARIRPMDSQRIQRALEVCYLTGEPLSEILRKPRHNEFPYEVIKIALIPGVRKVLHQRIAQRFDEMLRHGLIDEVRSIRDNFPVEMASPAMRCVGYRQTWLHLQNQIEAPVMRDMAVAATRQLAKRQLTWLRSMKDTWELDCLDEDLGKRVCEYLATRPLKTLNRRAKATHSATDLIKS